MLTKAQIAQDVIKWIDSGVLIPISVYKPDWLVSTLEDAKSVITHEIKEKKCFVCAKGALLLATIVHKNEISCVEANNIEMNGCYLSEYITEFTPEELDDLENLFEFYINDVATEEQENYLDEIDNIRNGSRSKWLRLLMESVIKHDGFYPDKFIADNPLSTVTKIFAGE